MRKSWTESLRVGESNSCESCENAWKFLQDIVEEMLVKASGERCGKEERES